MAKVRFVERSYEKKVLKNVDMEFVPRVGEYVALQVGHHASRAILDVVYIFDEKRLDHVEVIVK